MSSIKFTFLKNITSIVLLSFAVLSYAGDPDIFYYVCDGSNTLWSIDRTTGAKIEIGGTGVSSIEAIAFWPGTNALYGTDAGTFGRLDKSTGAFTSIGDVDNGGCASGADGCLALSDIDGLSFDPWTGKLWASSRRSGDFDLMFQIDTTNGAFVTDAFGPGLDYIVIDGSGVYLDVDDIAIRPTDGKMFTTSTQGGSAQLLEVNQSTGAVTFAATLQFSDVEGMAYHNDGTFWGTRGTSDDFYQILADGSMTGQVSLAPSCGDPEAIASLVADASTVSGRVWEDTNYNDVREGAEVGVSGITLNLYYDVDGDGTLDAEDFLIQQTVTDGSGDYAFQFSALASLIIKVDETSLPVGYAITGQKEEFAVFADAVNFGEIDSGNDFGIASGSDCDGDGIPDFVESTGDSDGDGALDQCDLDSDNDGILDSDEGNGDTDGDGVPNYKDLDSDNDGIPDAVEINKGVFHANYDASSGVFTGTDTDGDGLLDFIDNDPAVPYGVGSTSGFSLVDSDEDGVLDHLDLDSDNDGVLDVKEAGGTDDNGDGRIDGFTDDNLNGYHDDLTTSALPITNTDSATETADGTIVLANYLDSDSDGDGIPDAVESFSTADYSEIQITTDQDQDGIIDHYDITFGGTPALNPVDTDSDGTADYMDTDSDGDGTSDLIEGNDADFNSVADVNPSGVDANENGIDDIFESCVAALSFGTLDYAEERVSSGAVNLTSSDLELTEDGTNEQIVGVQFGNISLAQGTTIIDAYIQFQADESGSTSTDLVIHGEDINSASGFTTTTGNVSNRTTTSDSVLWSPASWTAGDEGVAQRSPSIVTIVQSILDRPGWALNNEMAMIISGIGRRTAETNPSLIIETSGTGCASNVALQNEDGDAEPDFRDLKNTSNPGVYWVVCDDQNTVKTVNRFSGEIQSIGAAGVGDIEAIAYWPGTSELFAANGGDLGTIDQSSGTFTAIGEIDGGGTAAGVFGDIGLNDVDGLSFDPWTGVLWGSNRLTTNNDVLFQIDPISGLFISDAFGAGVDYIEVGGASVYADVDDISISPSDGEMYTVATDGSGNAQILNINKNTGVITILPDLDRTDVEGMAYHNDGTFWGTDGVLNEFFQINLDGTTNGVVDLNATTTCTDPEALAALVAPANEICGNVWQDDDMSGDINGAESGLSGVTLNLYKDENGNGIVDGSDALIQSFQSDGNGDFQFFFAAVGSLIVEVDVATMPSGFGLTTSSTQTIVFSDNVNFCETSCGNNFGGVGGADCDTDGTPDFNESTGDLDGDGLTDACDLDSDNDGILDAIEGIVDTDGDGVLDRNDLDSDNDGIPDALEANSGVAPIGYNAATGRIVGIDIDGDGLIDTYDSQPGVPYGGSSSTLPIADTDCDAVFDHLDGDSDNDGIMDVVEAGGTDSDGDAVIDAFLDANNDGYSDALNGAPLAITNTDSFKETTSGHTQKPDYIDLDADGDGIDDSREAQTSVAYTVPASSADNNGNGIIDFYDINQGGAALVPTNTDGSGSPDYQDTDSDDDTVLDEVEANDANSDGVADSNASGNDTDNDGIDDNYDNLPSTKGGVMTLPLQNFDGDLEADWRDSDDDGDGINTESETSDVDGSGIPDYLEISACGPGYVQVGGGITSGNADAVVRNSGVANSTRALSAPNASGAQLYQGTDQFDLDLTDIIPSGTTYSVIWRQGPGQNNTSRMQVFESIDDVTYNEHPNSPFATNNESFFAEDIVANQNVRYLRFTPTNNRDLEIDAVVYSFSSISCERDNDLDGVFDSADNDDDNDGIEDLDESFGEDPNGNSDGDLVDNYLDPDYVHAKFGACVDGDSDGECEVSVWDTDGDGIPNHLDLDSDNDGLRDAEEANGGTMPSNMNNNGQYPTAYVSSNDSDGDGLADDVDQSTGGVALPLTDSDSDGLLPDFIDLDSDGDAIVDAVEANDGVLPSNMTQDGRFTIAYAQANDGDGDGIVDDVDLNNGGTALPNSDFDGDGLPNYRDTDSDADQLSDQVEGLSPFKAAANNDTDCDGVDDAYDVDFPSGQPANLPDLDCNGIVDYLDQLIIGHADGDWNLTGTWTNAVVPVVGESVVIASGHDVVLDSDISVGSLTIESGASFDAGNFEVIITGNLEVTGTGVFDAGTSNVIFQGNCAQTISGDIKFNNLNIDNANGVSISSGSSSVCGVVELTEGEFSTCSGTFTLISNAQGTAMVDYSGAGTINCDVTVERYVEGCKGWATLGAQIIGATFEEWNDEYETAGFPGADLPSNSTNIYWYNEKLSGTNDIGYTAPSSITQSLVKGLGYFVYLKANQVPTTFDMTGSLEQSSVTFPIDYTVTSSGNNHDGFNLLANPYAASLDWYASGWSKVSCCDAVYSWNRCGDQYSSFVAGVEVNDGTQYIGPGQGFWVKVHAPNAQLSVTPDATVTSDVSIFKQQLENTLRFTLRNQSYGQLSDQAAIRFVDGASPTSDPYYDADQLFTDAPNQPTIYSYDEVGKKYSINGLPNDFTNIQVQMGIRLKRKGNYVLSFEELGEFPAGACILLEDLITGEMVSVVDGGSYVITETAKYQDYPNRFVLHISVPPTPSVTNASCSNASDGVVALDLGPAGALFDVLWNEGEYSGESIIGVGPGVYEFAAIHEATGCSYSGSVVVHADDAVSANFEVVKDTVFAGIEIVEFVNKSEGGFQFNWMFGDGQSSPLAEPIHVYHYPGEYTVGFEVTNGVCTDEQYHQVVVIDYVLGNYEGSSDFDDHYKIYPNPIVDEFTISPVDYGDEILKVVVLDAAGQEVIMLDDFNHADLSVNVVNLAIGTYFTRIHTTSGVYIKKLVKTE